MRNIKNQRNTNFQSIKGVQIRRQYFTPLLYVVCIMFFMLSFHFISLFIIKNELSFSETINAVGAYFVFFVVVAIPLFILNVLNMALFGEVVCTLTENGLQCKSGFFNWDEIIGMSYELPLTRFSYKKIVVTIQRKNGQKLDVFLYKAPYRLLNIVKKQHPHIFVEVTSESKIIVAFSIVLIIVLPIVTAL